MSLFVRIGKSSAVYTAANILQKGMAFLLLPLYTRYLTPDDYGTLAVVNAINAFLVIIFTFSLHGAMTRYYFEYRHEPRKLKEFWGTILTFVLCLSLAGGTIFLLVGEYLLKPVIGAIPFWPFVALGIITSVFQPFFMIFLSLLQTMERPQSYAFHSLAQFIMNLILTVTLVVYLGWGAEGPLWAALVTSVIFFTVSLYSLRHNLRAGIMAHHLKPALSYSLPLVPHLMAAQAQSVADRAFLNSMVNTATAGLYNIGYMIGGVMGVVTESVNRAYVPVSMDALQSREDRQFQALKRVGLALTVLYCMLATLMSFFAVELVRIFTAEAFHGSFIVIPYIAFSFVLLGTYYIFVNILFFVTNATRFVVVGTLVGVVSNLLLNWLLIPVWGLRGAAGAALLSQMCCTVVIGVIGRSFEHVRWDYLKMAVCVGISFAVSLIVSGINFSGVFGTAAVKLTCFGIYFLGINLLIWRDPVYMVRYLKRLLKSGGRVGSE